MKSFEIDYHGNIVDKNASGISYAASLAIKENIKAPSTVFAYGMGNQVKLLDSLIGKHGISDESPVVDDLTNKQIGTVAELKAKHASKLLLIDSLEADRKYQFFTSPSGLSNPIDIDVYKRSARANEELLIIYKVEDNGQTSRVYTSSALQTH